ncbi:MAG: signal transduction histidine kinase/ligand-binding sensor domain-containing protein, partial [Phenylobacterium sp.]
MQKLSSVFIYLFTTLLSPTLWLVLCLLLPMPTWAKLSAFHFDNLTNVPGLQNLFTLKVIQDPQGYIWVATQDGLFRYDGYHFKAFYNHPDDPTSLSDNYVQTLYVDKQQRLWVGTQNGLNLLDHKTLKFKRYIHRPQVSNSLSNDYVMSISERHDGLLWVGTFGGGLNLFDPNTESFSHFMYDKDDPTSLSNNRIYTQITDHQGDLWVATRDGGLNRLNHKSGIFTRYQHDPNNPNSLSHNKIYALVEDADNILWVGTRGGGLNRFNRQDNTFTHFRHDADDIYSLGSDHVFALFADKNNALWVGTQEGGLNLLDKQTHRFNRYQSNLQNNASLNNNNVMSITQDQTGLLWVGTFGGGISKFDPDSKRFGLMRHNPNNPDSISSNEVRAIFKDKQNQLWIGTGRGLDRYDPLNDRFDHFNHQPNNPQSLASNHVSAIYQDLTGDIWVGTRTNGLSRFNQQSQTFKHYCNQSGDNSSLSDDIIRTIHQDQRGNLWVGTSNGLNRFNPKTNSFTRYHHDADDPDSITADTVYVLYSDRRGWLWAGTSEGLNLFNHENGKFIRYQHIVDQPNSLSHDAVYSIYQDPQGLFWLGTGGGLNKFDPNKRSFIHYRQKDGLSSDGIFAVLPDKTGKLWLGVGVGEQSISVLDPLTGEIKNNIGAAANCNSGYNVYFGASDGQLFFGGDGYCAFYPEQAASAGQPPALVFTDFRILNKSTLLHTTTSPSPLTNVINHTQSVTLSHLENILSFEFSALHYTDPPNNRYQYKLEGFNKDWIETAADNRRATFTNLAPGDYTFRVKGSNNEALWNPQERMIKLTIKPAPWHTWWAYTAYTLLISLLVGVIGWQRHQRGQALILAKNNAEKANEAKSTFIANVSHEIRTPLNAVLGYAQMLSRDQALNPDQRSKLDIIEKSGSHLLNLINDILDISKIEANAMSLATVDFELVTLVEGIAVMLAGRCEEKKLNWQLINHCDDFISVHGDQCKLRQILINLLGNAVKFTSEGTVTLTLSSTGPNSYHFEVSDSGPGIEKAHQSDIFNAFGQTSYGAKHGGTGLGLAIASNQVSLMGGRLKLKSTLGTGSQFYFALQLPPAKGVIDTRQSRSRQALKLVTGVKLAALVVDDIWENRNILKLMLEDIGIDVSEASHGKEALDTLHQAESLPELVFMDIRMPQMDGLTALKQIRLDFGSRSP